MNQFRTIIESLRRQAPWLLGLAATVIAAVGFNLLADPAVEARQGAPGDFDYYVLSLSWSPTYCATDARADTRDQCREDRAFIVHGLWPQYERGYPEYCSTSWPLRLPARLLDSYDAITPDRGLLAHQWRKHGVCTGLSPEDYLDTAKAFRQSIRVPRVLRSPKRQISMTRDDMVSAFVETNEGLDTTSLAIVCEGRRLDEVRICMTKDGKPRRCGDDVLARSCGRSPMIVLPVSGG
ncbi:MAG: ribonuclease [Pseudomonadota bacterium]